MNPWIVIAQGLAVVIALISAGLALRARRGLIVGAEAAFVAMIGATFLGINQRITWGLFLVPAFFGVWIVLRWLDRKRERGNGRSSRVGVDDQSLR
jgi:hypothetical protein